MLKNVHGLGVMTSEFLPPNVTKELLQKMAGSQCYGPPGLGPNDPKFSEKLMDHRVRDTWSYSYYWRDQNIPFWDKQLVFDQNEYGFPYVDTLAEGRKSSPG